MGMWRVLITNRMLRTILMVLCFVVYDFYRTQLLLGGSYCPRTMLGALRTYIEWNMEGYVRVLHESYMQSDGGTVAKRPFVGQKLIRVPMHD